MLRTRPFHASSADHVRGHVFLCMLAYYLEWHLRQRLAPMLFQDDDPDGTSSRRTTPVEPAKPSESAPREAATETARCDTPVHSLRTLLQDLANLTCNEVSVANQPGRPFMLLARPTALQEQAFRRLGVDPSDTTPVAL